MIGRRNKIITQEEMDKIIEDHQHWLKEDCEGWENMRCILNDAEIEDLHIIGVDLRSAIFDDCWISNTMFDDSDLSNSLFKHASFNDCSFVNADVSCAFFISSFFRYSNLSNVNANGASFDKIAFEHVNMKGAHFTSSIFVKVALDDSEIVDAYSLPDIPLACPSSGSFIGWKKVLIFNHSSRRMITTAIAKLEIPEDAKRSSELSNKCRCDKAKVISIESLDGERFYQEAVSYRDHSFIYKVGETVSVPNFDECRWHECSSGIHFFIDKQAAIDY